MEDKVYITYVPDEYANLRNGIKRALNSKGIGAKWADKDLSTGPRRALEVNKLFYDVNKYSDVTVIAVGGNLISKYPGDTKKFYQKGIEYEEILTSLNHNRKEYIKGIVAVVEDELYENLFITYQCSDCGKAHNYLKENEMIGILRNNMMNVKDNYRKNGICTFDWMEDSYISLVRLSDFEKNPTFYIDNAKEKKFRQISNNEFKINVDDISIKTYQ